MAVYDVAMRRDIVYKVTCCMSVAVLVMATATVLASKCVEDIYLVQIALYELAA